METSQAFALGFANRGKEPMVFDWDKAALLIVEHGAKEAKAGLRGDWEYTGGDILRDGEPVPQEETYVYLASTWAVPELSLDGIPYECYRMESQTPNWDSDTYWPLSAVAILKGLK